MLNWKKFVEYPEWVNLPAATDNDDRDSVFPNLKCAWFASSVP
jgi:hypothetical protein